MCYKNDWATVCDDAWDTNDAQVVCTQLGYSTTGAFILSSSDVPDGAGLIWLDKVNCVGTEISLFNCDANFSGSHDCNHTDDVGVICQHRSSHIKLFDLIVNILSNSFIKKYIQNMPKSCFSTDLIFLNWLIY